MGGGGEDIEYRRHARPAAVSREVTKEADRAQADAVSESNTIFFVAIPSVLEYSEYEFLPLRCRKSRSVQKRERTTV